MTDLARPLSRYLTEHLPHERGASRHTVRAYVCTFNMLVTFAAGRLGTRPCKLTVADLDTDTLLAFLDHLETDRKNGVTTRNMRLASIKAFFRFLEFRYPQHLEIAARVRAIPSKRADQSSVDCLAGDEVKAILNAPNRATRTGLRDHAMLGLAYNAGLRVSELVGLSLGSLKQPELDQVRVMGKGRRGRMLPLWKQTADALHNWLDVRPDGADQHLFLNSSGRGMTSRGFAKRLAVHAEAAASVAPSIATKAVSPHSLRHACALRTLEATGDIRQVALWLGHASQQTTEMYLRIDPVEKLRILSKQKPPEISEGNFQGVRDELLAMLARIKG